MNQFKIYLTLLLLTFFNVYSHEDSYDIKDFGNIKIRIKTGYNYEEVNKVMLFGKLAQQLSDKLNYSNQIFLDFDHYYIGLCEKPAYFISFDNGNYGVGFREGKPEKNFLKKKSLVIRQCSDRFDLKKTLQLLEYSIQNEIKIKTEQREINYQDNYCNWKIKTINRNQINKIINSPITELVFSLLNQKVYQNEENENISYYLKNNIFTITYKNRKGELNEIIELNNIYFLFKIDKEKVIVFEDKNSFYYINKDIISKKHYIPNHKVEYSPYKLEIDKVFFSFYYYKSFLTGNDNAPFLKTLKIEHKYFIIKDKLLIDSYDNFLKF
jgi:hypothetical protein